jgi:hypothetical protein
MNSTQPYRRPVGRPREPAPKPDTVITPLTGPDYGPFAVVKRKWRKPLPAVIADCLANSAEISARLDRGVYAPDRGRITTGSFTSISVAPLAISYPPSKRSLSSSGGRNEKGYSSKR